MIIIYRNYSNVNFFKNFFKQKMLLACRCSKTALILSVIGVFAVLAVVVLISNVLGQTLGDGA